MINSTFTVITSVQEPTWSVLSLADRMSKMGARLIVIGDKKGPTRFDLPEVDFFSLEAQQALNLSLARNLPSGHYARKNIGYLIAIQQGAERIYETDDDNAPLENWHLRDEVCQVRLIETTGWVNIYRQFTDDNIWPRGFPLDAINHSANACLVSDQAVSVRSAIQQGLANHSPDVDAIWRLVLDKPFDFVDGPSVALPRGAWCPFNSQSTWWFPVAYPLMYLPSYCSFRMTDIWRSFIAQRCLWELGMELVFHSPEVIQERNAHDLMRDFRDEIPGYTRNRELVVILEQLTLAEGEEAVGSNLLACYEALTAVNAFPVEEVALVKTWLADLQEVRLSLQSEAVVV